jgi:hypothetical protein
MNKEDIDDIKTVLNIQLALIQRLCKMPMSSLGNQTIYNEILDCNKIMMEIVCGPIGGIEKLLEKTNEIKVTYIDGNRIKPIPYDFDE